MSNIGASGLIAVANTVIQMGNFSLREMVLLLQIFMQMPHVQVKHVMFPF